MNTKNEITDQTRLNIIDAFLDLTKTTPVKKIKVQDIMQASGYNRSTFYRYFTNIHDLQDYINQYIKPKLYFKPKVSIRKHTDISMQQIIDNCKELLNDNLDKMKLARTADTKKRFQDEFCRIVSASLLKSAEQLDEKVKEQFKLLVGYHVNGSAHLFLDYANNQYHLTIDEFSELFAEIHFHGIFTMMNKLREPRKTALKCNR